VSAGETVREVEVAPLDLERLGQVLPPGRAELLRETAATARELLRGRVIWSVNSTAHGGGVAEMLASLLSYSRGAGVDARWLVIGGDAEFFTITKRLHNRLHGARGDGGALDAAALAHYQEVLAGNLPEVAERIRPNDIVLLHDPQTAGLVDGLLERSAAVVWRCHIGSDMSTPETTEGWEFLRPFIDGAAACIFSRQQYAPEWLGPDKLRVVAPSIDPFSAKNLELAADGTVAMLVRAGLLTGPVRRELQDLDVQVRRHERLLVGNDPPPVEARLILQVSRWDRLKDMAGVLSAFGEAIDTFPDDVHLMLAGPDVSGVADDPEGAEVLAECVDRWSRWPLSLRRRVHLAMLPMDDPTENALLVNALQRHASIVTQKSLAEGFGLTVTEAMWKARPVVASAVGGIPDQIVDGRDGILLDDPHDLDLFARLLERLLRDDGAAGTLGARARERVRDRFLGDRHLEQYVDLFAELTAAHR
jgi:trehalose synthase